VTKQASVDPGKAIVDPAPIQRPCRADLAAWEAMLDDWLPSCMGGWCTLRDRCQHYVAKRRRIVERLCEPVRATYRHFIPIQQEH
jgi:hypothetical protein